jgi:hypothetical protein
MPELNFQDIQRAGDIAAPVVSGKGSARFPLSASLSGSPIPVGTSNTLVHTFPINTNAMEELYLYAYNYSSTTYNVSMSLATGSADAFVVNNIITPVSAQTGMTLCYPGIPHKSTSSKNPLKVYVKTKDSATALGVLGYVIRYYPIDNEGNQAAETYGYSTE